MQLSDQHRILEDANEKENELNHLIRFFLSAVFSDDLFANVSCIDRCSSSCRVSVWLLRNIRDESNKFDGRSEQELYRGWND